MTHLLDNTNKQKASHPQTKFCLGKFSQCFQFSHNPRILVDFPFLEIFIQGIGQQEEDAVFVFLKQLPKFSLVSFPEIPARFAKQEGDISDDKFTPMFDITLAYQGDPGSN